MAAATGATMSSEPAASEPQEHAVQSSGPLPIPYTAQEVGKTFAELLVTFDFRAEMLGLGIGRFDFLKRVAAKRHLTAISIALWHIALEKSFPNDAEAFFTHFTTTYPPLTGGRGGAKKLHDLVTHYDTLIAEKKDSDFTAVADTLVETLKIVEADKRRQQLRLSLQVRAIFELVFKKLI